MIQEVIQQKDLLQWLADHHISSNAEVLVKQTKSSLTFRISYGNEVYSPIAKCGKYSGAHCLRHWRDCEDCLKCTLIKRQTQSLYKMINGVKHKKCPRCSQYLPITSFSMIKDDNGRLYSSWCKECYKDYNHNYRKKK